MVSFKLISVLAAAAPLFAMAAADDSSSSSSSSSSLLLIPTPTKTVAASAMSTAGCFATGTPLEDHGPGMFQSSGACQQICLGLGKDVLGLSEGNRCWCGDEFPPLNMKVANSSCSTTCSGISQDICGGKNKLWVMTTGNTRNPIDYAANITDTSSSSSSSAAATSQSTSTAVATATASSDPKSGGPNTAGIAAGVVVGVVALAAIVGGVFFYLRQKKRREVEEEYRRQASLNPFVGGKPTHTSNSSMTDSRLDPDFLARRQSNGSIADNEDYSRRILKVTNA